MTHPITPPPELVQQWFTEQRGLSEASRQQIATLAAQWGADQELEACCHCFARDLRESLALELRARRRPKPPSLKEQALSDFDGLMSELDGAGNYSNCAERIRRALEQLDD